MKENNLYKNISQMLFNVFNIDYLKANIILNKSFCNLVIDQINILLTLEKGNDCLFENTKLSISFAQYLVNLLNRKSSIEKIDNNNFEELDNKYLDFIDFTSKEFEITKSKLKADDVELSLKNIASLTILSHKEAEKIIDEHQKKETPFNNNSQQNKNNNFQNQNINNNFQNQNTNAPYGSGFGGGFGGGFGQYNANAVDGFPVHPIADQRFYPYRSKNKWMPIFKKVFASVIIFTITWIFVITLIGKYDPVNLGNVWVSKGSSGMIPPIPGFSPKTTTGFTQVPFNYILPVSLAGLIFAFISLIPAVWVGIDAFGAPKFLRQKYIIKWPILILIIIVMAMSLYSSIAFILPNTLGNNINSFYNKNLSVTFYGGKKIPPDDWAAVTNSYITKIENTSLYKAIFKLEIFLIVLIGLSIIATIVAMAVNPVFARAKVMRAHQEYSKAVNLKMQNKDYKIDPSLYDEDLTAEYEKMKKADEEKINDQNNDSN